MLFVALAAAATASAPVGGLVRTTVFQVRAQVVQHCRLSDKAAACSGVSDPAPRTLRATAGARVTIFEF